MQKQMRKSLHTFAFIFNMYAGVNAFLITSHFLINFASLGFGKMKHSCNLNPHTRCPHKSYGPLPIDWGYAAHRVLRGYVAGEKYQKTFNPIYFPLIF